jgi:hypothetical protein
LPVSFSLSLPFATTGAAEDDELALTTLVPCDSDAEADPESGTESATTAGDLRLGLRGGPDMMVRCVVFVVVCE